MSIGGQIYEAMDNLMPLMVIIMIGIIIFQNINKKKKK